MYKVVSEGNVVAYCDKPPYVKVVDGYSKPCPITQANGIVAGGNCYNIIGMDEAFPGRPVAWVHKVDSGEVAYAESQRTDNNTTKITEVDDTALASLEATTDLYEQLLDKGVLD
jgi:hypothetical protein